MIRAIIINPNERVVSEVHLRLDPEQGVNPEIRRIVGAGFVRGGLIRGFGAEDAVYVDDEGLSRSSQNFFFLRGWTQPLAGVGVIVGLDPEGEIISASVSLREVEKRIRFPAVTRI